MEKNSFLKGLDDYDPIKSHSKELAEKVKFWSDYNSQYYHPKTVIELDEYPHGDDTRIFQSFSQGIASAHKSAWAMEYVDEHVRRLMEECDSAQGFQIIADSNNGFAGLTCAVVELLQEEYLKKSMFVFGISNSSKSKSKFSRIEELNQVLFLNAMMETDSTFVPLHLPINQDIDSDLLPLTQTFNSLYQSSGYIASAIDTITLPFRYRNLDEKRTFADVQSLLRSPTFGSVYSLSCSFVPVKPASSLVSNGKVHINKMRNLTLESNYSINEKSWVILRGMKNEELKKLYDQEKNSVLSLYPHPFALTNSFPQLFDVDWLRDYYGHPDLNIVDSMPIVASLQSGPCMDRLFKRAHSQLQFTAKDSMTLSNFTVDSFEWDHIRESISSIIYE
jgi:hypothetical protein